MGNYRFTINPHTGRLQKVLSDDYIQSTASAVNFEAGVDTVGDLPSSGNTVNDARFVNDTHHLYIWNGSSWQDQGDIIDITWGALEGKPTSTVGDIDDAVTKKHDKQHNLNSTTDHLGLSGTGIEDNFMAIDANGLPKDSGQSASDFANASHNHVESDITDLDHYDSTDFDTDFATKNISDLADVLFDTGTPTDGQVLTYDSGTSKWKAETPSAGAGDMLKSVYDTGDNGVVDNAENTQAIKGKPVDAPATGATDDNKVLTYDAGNDKFILTSKGIYFSSYTEDETESTTTDDVNWQNKETLVYTAPEAGNYLLGWTAEIANSGANKGTYFRVIMDNVTGGSATELNTSLNAPIVANGWLTSTGFKRVTLDTNQHTFDLDFKAETSTSTAKVRRARIEIRKVA